MIKYQGSIANAPKGNGNLSKNNLKNAENGFIGN